MPIHALYPPGPAGRARRLISGLVVSAMAAAAASVLSAHYGASVMLFALLPVMARNFLSVGGACQGGMEFTSRGSCCASVWRCLGCASPPSRCWRWAGSRCG